MTISQPDVAARHSDPGQVASGFLSLGQTTARDTVVRAAATGRLDRTLLIHGPTGAGKGAFVADLLALLFCQHPLPARRPCNECRGCRQARARSHPDLVVGSPEFWREARSTGESIVGVARRWLIESAGAPLVAERRVILIEGADRANEQTQNALLKVLEEPAPRQMFVLVADEPSRLLPTIRSRSQSLRIGAVPRPLLVEWLMEHRRLPAEQADALARMANGLPGAALHYADDSARVEWWRRTQSELVELLDRGRADRFGSIRDLLDAAGRVGLDQAAADPDPDGTTMATAGQRLAALSVIGAWVALSRDLLVTAAGRAALAPAVEIVPSTVQVAPRVDPVALLAFIGQLEEAHEALRQNAAPVLTMQRLMLAWPTLSRSGSGSRE